MERCSYCKRFVWKKTVFCPDCGSRLGTHRHRGPRMSYVLFAMSVIIGAPLGSLLALSLDEFILYHRLGIIVEILGALFGSLLLYTFILLHNRRR